MILITQILLHDRVRDGDIHQHINASLYTEAQPALGFEGLT